MSTELGCKMATPFLVIVLFGCVWSAAGQAELMKLDDGYKAGALLAVDQVNAHPGVQQHFLFFRSIKKSEVDAGFGAKYLSHHFHLKATRCSKATAAADSSKCAFRNDRPVIDCMTCYKTYNDVIQEKPKPYIHCIHKPALTKDMIKVRTEYCEKMSYSTGSATLLGVRRNN
ncbi:hypothetical protein KOW79_018698 [Hemibagrus wyckioides]|uniref:Retinoic acid receptor responder protein 2 n=1 Tax=Hemibagrus wyckioides TaxID=337641 RepID=A0A9D3N789_9TELE|nr:hypothetical protein KOW79_018698 [Hemibagrus wyckioides]